MENTIGLEHTTIEDMSIFLMCKLEDCKRCYHYKDCCEFYDKYDTDFCTAMKYLIQRH